MCFHTTFNDLRNTAFSELPLEGAKQRFTNNLSVCLKNQQQAIFDSLTVTTEVFLKVQEETVTESLSDT